MTLPLVEPEPTLIEVALIECLQWTSSTNTSQQSKLLYAYQT